MQSGLKKVIRGQHSWAGTKLNMEFIICEHYNEILNMLERIFDDFLSLKLVQVLRIIAEVKEITPREYSLRLNSNSVC